MFLRTMLLTKARVLALSAAAASGAVLLAQPPAAEAPKAVTGAAEKAPRASKLDLTPESLPKFLALIRPQEDEWRHLRVKWVTDPVAALKKAAAEDKPLVFLHMGGAGYNESLGVC